MYPRSTQKSKKHTKGYGSYVEHSSSLQKTLQVQQKKVTDKVLLLLNCSKFLATPLNTLLYITLQTAQIRVSGDTFRDLCIFLLLFLSFTVPVITEIPPNQLRFFDLNLRCEGMIDIFTRNLTHIRPTDISDLPIPQNLNHQNCSSSF